MKMVEIARLYSEPGVGSTLNLYEQRVNRNDKIDVRLIFFTFRLSENWVAKFLIFLKKILLFWLFAPGTEVF